MKRLRAAVIGTGGMGSNHVRVYSEIEDVELVSISDINKSTLKPLAERFGCKAYTDYKKMIEKEDIDVVSIAVPTTLHKEVAMNVINSKINLLVEKPIAANPQEAEEIIQCATKNNVRLTVGHIERFNPVIVELKKRLEKNELGRLFKIDIKRVGPFFRRVRDTDVITDLAIHDIDILLYLLKSDISRVFAEVERNVSTEHEDSMSCLIRMKNNVLCSINVNWITPKKIREMTIVGKKGMFKADYIKQELFLYKNMINMRGEEIKIGIEKKEPLKEELNHFISCIKNNKEPNVNPIEAKKAIEIADLIKKSAKLESVIK